MDGLEALSKALMIANRQSPEQWASATSFARSVIEALENFGWRIERDGERRSPSKVTWDHDGKTIDLTVAGAWFKVKDMVGFVVFSPIEMDRAHPEINGQWLTVDGERRKVVAVERFMPASPIGPGEKIGLFFHQRESIQETETGPGHP